MLQKRSGDEKRKGDTMYKKKRKASKPPTFEVAAAKFLQPFGQAEAPRIHESAIREKHKSSKKTVTQLTNWFHRTEFDL